jgi:hypothetical protein
MVKSCRSSLLMQNSDVRNQEPTRPWPTDVALPHVMLPRSVAGRLVCPRCEARLQFDGDELVCLPCGSCGYRHSLTPALRRTLAHDGRYRK